MADAPKPLRVGVVGAGYFANFHYDAWSRLPGVSLVASCDLDTAKATAMAGRYGAAQVFSNPEAMLDAAALDLVDIATPPGTHAAIVRSVADRGLPVICQKAFCATLEEARATVDYCAARNVVLVVHENFRFQPWHRAIRRVLDSGEFGEIYQATFRLRPGDGQGPDAYLSRQPYFQKMPRFLIRETGIHFIDTFRFLLGEVTGVYASLRRLNLAIAGEDAGIVQFDFASGARGLFDANRLSDHIAEDRRRTMGDMWIEATRGTLRLDGNGRLFQRSFGSNAERLIDTGAETSGFAGDSVFALQRHVVGHLRAGAPLENSGKDYLRNLEIEDAIYRSQQSRSYVSL